ncbi:flagellar hook protein FlgE [Sphingomonas hengshuiensis]|uniref:Flagellar hook protein FlgE n=1 Tax=Sphingomonas hengshuiensis TaxID=1609977 RepID=A0A7U4JB61_9SPHN|nr:flagellar hook protein FlgE [Sphingomonas hengshuiensis]AJP73522.1 hypothetical protein TS85_19605 [Sphingomonas hengshuiensis]
MSFYTALSGLQGAQSEMAAISNNIANVSTNGFKKSATQFADVIASTSTSSPTQIVGSGTVVKSVRQQFGQGGFTQTDSALDVAISGDGFFVVKGSGAGNSVSYTRNGSFQVDASRTVVDGQGNALQVYPVDSTGSVAASGLGATTSLKLPATSGTPVATSKVALSVDLSANATIPSEAAEGSTAFDRTDPSTYNNSTQTTIYDASGNALTMTSYFVRDTAPTEADASSSWSVYSFVGDQQLSTATGDAVSLTFDASGTLTAPTTATALTGFTPAGATTEQPLTLDFGTATNQAGSVFSVDAKSQDGKTVGQFQSVAIADDGTVTATFSNGDTQALGKVVLANFANPAGLRQLGDSSWAATGISGDPQLAQPGDAGTGALMSGAIEQSNVDITEELVALIAAQRNFQANAKALDTASQLSQTIFNIRS